MARFLALDWDHERIHVVSANVSKGAVQILRAEVWEDRRIPNLAQAEELGDWLRERLKLANIPPSPVLVCIGRDRLILKDLRFPPVPAHEEPTLVRFQVTKELHDNPDDVIIDYAPTGDSKEGRDRRALVMIARRELVGAYQRVCRAAGLKLESAIPRPYGIAACLVQQLGKTVLTPHPADEADPLAVLTVAEKWAEFCVVRKGMVLFSRSLPVGPTLAAEIRRSIAVYSGQSAQNGGSSGVQALYVAGGADHSDFRQRLEDMLEIPIHSFDPLFGAKQADVPDGVRGAFAGAVGLLQVEAFSRKQVIDFVRPRQARAPENPSKKKAIVAGIVAAVLLAFGGILAFGYYSNVQRKKKTLLAQLATLDDQERTMTPDVTNFDTVKGQMDASVNSLDELYEITALNPNHDRLTVHQLHFTQQTRGPKDKDKDYVGKIVIEGRVDQADKKLADDYRNAIKEDPHYRPASLVVETVSGEEGQLKFVLVVDVKKRDPAAFNSKIDVSALKDRKPDKKPSGKKGSSSSKTSKGSGSETKGSGEGSGSGSKSAGEGSGSDPKGSTTVPDDFPEGRDQP